MRLIFVDESGTSTRHNSVVVAAVILEADDAVMKAERLLDEALLSLPPQLRADFRFSAKDVWGNPGYPTFWRMADRISLLKSILRIPRTLKQAISICIFDKGDPGLVNNEVISALDTDVETYAHLMAFSQCVCRADKYIRDYCGTEIGMIIAEDHQRRDKLAASLEHFRSSGYLIRPEGLIKSQKELELGYWTQQSDQKITRTRRSIHFVGKEDDRLVWLADAAAWALRKYFDENEDKFGFCHELLGRTLPLQDYKGLAMTTFFWP
jgi:Protein of unknown function (DUF3800)